MNREPHPSRDKKQRTTLTLPADSLAAAQQIARARKVNLSTVITEALNEGLRVQMAAARSEEVLEGYKRAFGGFSSEEMAILDGVILEAPAER
jgi:post-segregation antitoxin (ccd killing protein)